MEELALVVTIILTYTLFITLKYFEIKEESEINYSNYQNCLMALAEIDPSLKKHLEEKTRKNQKKKRKLLKIPNFHL